MNLTLNKAAYRPGETAACAVAGIPAGAARVSLTLWRLQETLAIQEQPAGGETAAFAFALPPEDFTGYLLQAQAQDAHGRALAAAFSAVDCSSRWSRFPRYGYVWDFTADADAEAKLRQLARYHINGLQFYDWQYRHHLPVAPDTAGWTDWTGRPVDGAVLRRYLTAAHGLHMACMAYNMIYAANRTYLTDGAGADPAWRLRKADGTDFTCEMDASLGPVGVLQYMNPLNPQWQAYLFAREREVFAAFDFDGWHGDTIGECGPMTDANGGPLGVDAGGNPIHTVKECYTPFLNAAKRAVGERYLSFNPVGAQGLEHVNVSDVDVLYAEFWPWDAAPDGALYDSYLALHQAILRAAAQSGGKSLVVAAYVNYRNPAPAFNAPAVRLLDSVVFASGGARIELGNGDGMLSDEYFPADRGKHMDGALRQAMERMYDFAVAYQNLLRDWQTPVERPVYIEGLPVSAEGRADTVWAFAMADARTEIYHLINLTGTDTDWRDTAQTKAEPRPQANLAVKLYTAFPESTAWLASPDGADLAPAELPLTRGADGRGAYLALTLPSLAYWDMIFLR